MDGRSVFPWSDEREVPLAVVGLVVVMEEGWRMRGKERRVGIGKDGERDLIMQEEMTSPCKLLKSGLSI